MPSGKIDKPDEIIVPFYTGERVIPVRFARSGLKTWTNVEAVTITYDDLKAGAGVPITMKLYEADHAEDR